MFNLDQQSWIEQGIGIGIVLDRLGFDESTSRQTSSSPRYRTRFNYF